MKGFIQNLLYAREVELKLKLERERLQLRPEKRQDSVQPPVQLKYSMKPGGR